MTLDELNGLDDVFEHSPWVAERARKKAPFRTVDELHAAMMAAVREASDAERLALIRAHPELAGAEAKEGTLSPHSSGEQGRLGLTALSKDEFRRISDINRRYRQKFGFPCIVALKLHSTRAGVLEEMERRVGNAREEELAAAIEQIGHITRGRLDRMFGKH